MAEQDGAEPEAAPPAAAPEPAVAAADVGAKAAPPAASPAAAPEPTAAGADAGAKAISGSPPPAIAPAPAAAPASAGSPVAVPAAAPPAMAVPAAKAALPAGAALPKQGGAASVKALSGVDMLTQLRARLGAASALAAAGKDGKAKAKPSVAALTASLASPGAVGASPGSLLARPSADSAAKSSVLGDLRSRLGSTAVAGIGAKGAVSGRSSPASPSLAGFQDLFQARQASGASSPTRGPGLHLNEMLAMRSKVNPTSPTGSLAFSILEKHAVVIDFGRRYTKVGIASEFRPRAVLCTPQLRRCRCLGKETIRTAPAAEWADVLKPLLGEIFLYHLGVTAKDRRVVICEHVDSPKPFREALTWLLFRHFLVASVSFVLGLAMPLYLTGLSTGVVIDAGYESTKVLATGAGVPILSAYTRAAAGGRHVDALIRRGLKAASLAGDWLDSEDVLEDVKVQACYVALQLEATSTFDGMFLKSNDDVNFMAPGAESPVKIPAECRWKPAEVFFSGLGDAHEPESPPSDEAAAPADGGEPSVFQLDLVDEPAVDFATVAAAFVETLLRCPIDSRRLVVQNVVVCGGSAMFRGFLPRLAVAIRDAIRQEPKTAKLVGYLRFTPLDLAPTWAVWVGGAMYGSLESGGDFTAEQYFRGHDLPDWITNGYA